MVLSTTGNGDPSTPAPVGAGGDSSRRWRARLVTAARSFPLTIAVTVVLSACAIGSRGLWTPVQSASWFDAVAYGVPALRDGQWWTVLTGSWFGLTPSQYVSLLVLSAGALAVGEWRLGTRTTAVVAISGQIGGVLVASAVIAAAQTSGWAWAVSLGEVRDVGCTTAVVAVLAATTATVPSPWRLRSRALLYGYVIISFLFLGRFADVAHLVVFAVFLLVGERWLSTGERGLRPRTRREARLTAALGLWAIAAVHVLVFFVPGDGPFGPTGAREASLWSMLVNVAVAGLLAEQLRRGRRWTWWAVLAYGSFTALASVVVVILVAATSFESIGAVTAGTGLLWAGEVFLLLAGRSAFTVPFRRRTGSGDVDTAAVRTLIRRYGGSTMSWMITWDDMHHYTASGLDGVIGYRRHAGALIALADPVVDARHRDPLLESFLRFAERQAAVPCLFSVSADTADRAVAMGWRTLQIAEDTLLDLPDLTLAGKKWQKVRSALNKAEKTGTVFVLARLSEQPDRVLAQVRDISEQWVGEKELPEMGFTLGTVEEALDDDVRVALAIDESGTVQAVLSWLPVYRGNGEVLGWTLDVMRKRTGPAANNMIEFLIAKSALAFKDEGAAFASLSGAPLARADAGTKVHGIDRGLDMLGQALEPFYGFRSLHHFKTKFNPRYEPVFLCYRDEADLPRIGVAISRAYLPDATPRELAALLQSSRT